MDKASVLIASPVNKNNLILKEFLNSLRRLSIEGIEVSYCFMDDNDDVTSSKMLLEFANEQDNAVILPISEKNQQLEEWEKGDHNWSAKKIEKVANYKNAMIEYFLMGEWSHLFFVDADLVLRSSTLINLINCDKDVISNIFWTRWTVNSIPLPQVWQKDFYTLYDASMLKNKTPQQIQTEKIEFLNMLRKPGVYKVGGLGACTLIKRCVLEAGVNFCPLYNISFWGEDRSFCIRAVAHDFELFVSTHYPAFHIFRMEELEQLDEWLREGEIH